MSICSVSCSILMQDISDKLERMCVMFVLNMTSKTAVITTAMNIAVIKKISDMAVSPRAIG